MPGRRGIQWTFPGAMSSGCRRRAMRPIRPGRRCYPRGGSPLHRVAAFPVRASGAGMRVGTPTPMTAACIGPDAVVDDLKDALSY